MTEARLVLSIASFDNARSTDGGFMIRVHLRGPDERDIALLIPPEAITKLTRGLTRAANTASKERALRGG